MKIFKRFSFEAGHKLNDYPTIHGHSYEAEIWFEGPATEGYVIPEDQLAEYATALRAKLDHRFLNDFIQYPTMENIARFIWRELAHHPRLHKICVRLPSTHFGVEYDRNDAEHDHTEFTHPATIL